MAVINPGALSNMCKTLCVDVQSELDGRADSPINNEDNQNAFINFLISDANNSNNVVQEALGELAGKAKPIAGVDPALPLTRLNVIWTSPECGETETCATAGDNICALTGTYESKRKYAEVTLDDPLCETGAFLLVDFLGICETSQFAMTDEIQRAARKLKRGLNKKAIESIAANLSEYADGVDSAIDPRIIPLITISADGLAMPNQAGTVMTRSEYRKKSWTGDFNIFGGDAVAEYNDLMEMRGMARTPFIYENKLDAIFEGIFADGYSNLLTLPTGVFNFLTYSRNDLFLSNPQLVAMSPNYIRTKLVIDGINYDFDLYYSECDAKVVWRLRIDFGFFKIPDTEYCEGTGGLPLRWVARCGDALCADFSINVPPVV